MKIEVFLDDANVDISQADYDMMWSMMAEDYYAFVHRVIPYLEEGDLDYYKEEFKPLYEKLRTLYEKD